MIAILRAEATVTPKSSFPGPIRPGLAEADLSER
jgi:hypothetical protein